ncbi:hydrogenase maturation nickel metallochaperone HypA [Halomonas sp. V046]|uniref:hydrogenase maturation nickel metallochaperone HypA n=1 Tax=Halomonas sp. V046 TaxID=3459611 RepID=UPI004044D069
MHEMSICQSIVDLIEEQALAQSFDRVSRVCLEIGVLSCVEPGALAFGFEVTTRGSIAEGATLDIVDVPASAWCFGCNETVEIARRGDDCPRCQGARLRVTGGEELRVKELEVV